MQKGFIMTDEERDLSPVETEDAESSTQEATRFPELAELQDKIQRRLRSNQRFLERFMDEDFEDLDDDEVDVSDDDEESDLTEEL